MHQRGRGRSTWEAVEQGGHALLAHVHARVGVIAVPIGGSQRHFTSFDHLVPAAENVTASIRSRIVRLREMPPLGKPNRRNKPPAQRERQLVCWQARRRTARRLRPDHRQPVIAFSSGCPATTQKEINLSAHNSLTVVWLHAHVVLDWGAACPSHRLPRGRQSTKNMRPQTVCRQAWIPAGTEVRCLWPRTRNGGAANSYSTSWARS